MDLTELTIKQQETGVSSTEVADVTTKRAQDLRNAQSDVAKRVKMDGAEDAEESREGLQRDGRFYAAK